MKRSVTALAGALLALALAGCGMFSDKLEDAKNWGAPEFYKAAKSEFDNGNWEASIKIYEALEAKFPYGRFAQQAQMESAYAYYKLGDTPQSISAIDKFAKMHPNHAQLDYMLYLRALVNFKEDLGPLTRVVQQDLADRDPKAARESFEGFKEVVNRFPNTRYAEDSRERMAYLVEALARHEVKVARYYLSRGAYLAAANRSQDCITRFPGSPSRREALDILVEAYDRMGLTELRDDARKVLARNYPDARMARDGQNRTRSWWKFW